MEKKDLGEQTTSGMHTSIESNKTLVTHSTSQIIIKPSIAHIRNGLTSKYLVFSVLLQSIPLCIS